MHIKDVLLNVTWQFLSDPDAHNYWNNENTFVVKTSVDLLCQSFIKSGRIVLSLARKQTTTANIDNGNQKTKLAACYQGSCYTVIM